MKSKIFKSSKSNKRVVTIALAIVTMLALLMTGCSASKSDEERYNDTKNMVSADSLKDDADYSKFEKKKDASKDESKETSKSDNNGEITTEESSSSDDSESAQDSGSNSSSSSTGSNGSRGSSNTCTISISCATILDNMDNLTEGKEVLVPSNGVILGTTTVEFSDGDTVFDILSRLTREYGIHMEYVNTPAYNSAYIEGIANLYEKDCGGGSGWMYCVNGWYPDYGCSQYYVKDGDVIQWNYTCDLGVDLGQTF